MNLRKQSVFKTSNEKGLTLVEVLASLILISLMLMTFLMIFGQTAKTNIASETIIDSTYIAQSEMETIYGLSKISSSLPQNHYVRQEETIVEGITWEKYKKKQTPSGVQIFIRVIDTDEKITRIIIEVYEGSKVNPSAKMETALIWEGTSE